jgi:PPK2 family polyphosphate:nucleotide phosphotransferase
MEREDVVATACRIAARHRVEDGASFRLDAVDPADTGEFGSSGKARAKAVLDAGVEALAELQDELYAQDRWSLLLVFQAMDAAGKDGAIKHVMSGVNPQGCQVASFKAPSAEELDHDYLWRCQRHLPERGRIGIFNRSYYEDVLVVKVHPELLAAQKLPAARVDDQVWARRYREIRDHERYLDANGTIVRKFFLHVSRAEQKRRFLERIDEPAKNWKFSAADVRERAHWPAYMAAYEQAIRETATPACPWYVVPADNKWYTRAVVASAVIHALASLGLHYPVVGPEKRAELAAARAALEAERD